MDRTRFVVINIIHAVEVDHMRYAQSKLKARLSCPEDQISVNLRTNLRMVQLTNVWYAHVTMAITEN